MCKYVCVCVCVCGDTGSRLIDEIGRSVAPCLFDELVGSCVRIINANLVHVRLKENDETGEKRHLNKHSAPFVIKQFKHIKKWSAVAGGGGGFDL